MGIACCVLPVWAAVEHHKSAVYRNCIGVCFFHCFFDAGDEVRGVCGYVLCNYFRGKLWMHENERRVHHRPFYVRFRRYAKSEKSYASNLID